jgi:transposase
MAFVNQSLSVYQVRPRHRNEEVRELIPADFQGVMVCDRGRSYDAVELEDVAQQKCLGHMMRNAKAVEESKTGRARQFSEKLKELLRQALALSAKKNEMDAVEYGRQVDQLNGDLTFHLRDRVLRDEDNQRLLNGVGAQHDRFRVLSFLTEEGVEPTNNRAERDLRPGSQRGFIHARRSLVAAHPLPRFPQNVTPVNPVVQRVKTPRLTRLGTHP